MRILSQVDADRLIALLKKLRDMGVINFPPLGEHVELEGTDMAERENFLIDVQRKSILPTKITYQLRWQVSEVLVRLDLDGPPHQNPDGEDIPTPHMHIYKEGYGTKWAIPVPQEFVSLDDPVKTLKDFLAYCHFHECPVIAYPLQ